jgi:hypothetical protein
VTERDRRAHHGHERRAAHHDHAGEEEEIERERDDEEGLAEQRQPLAHEAEAAGAVEAALEEGAGPRILVGHLREDGRGRARGKECAWQATARSGS